jgi:hypothetical protein
MENADCRGSWAPVPRFCGAKRFERPALCPFFIGGEMPGNAIGNLERLKPARALLTGPAKNRGTIRERAKKDFSRNA